MSKLFHLTHEEYVTLLPKSITTAIGMGVSEELGGYVTLSVAMIIIPAFSATLSLWRCAACSASPTPSPRA